MILGAGKREDRACGEALGLRLRKVQAPARKVRIRARLQVCLPGAQENAPSGAALEAAILLM